MSESPPATSPPDTLTVITVVQRWRRRVVRHWIVAMVAALALWAAAAVWPLTAFVEVSAGVTLALLIGRAFQLMRAGRCPRCAAPIRFEPRIELPRSCAGCGIDFFDRTGSGS